MKSVIRSVGGVPNRQIHLDFHNSPAISDLGADFDATVFAAEAAAAGAQSITLFAKCHHGMCYYPTHCGTHHPALKGRDLLGEQIEALHRLGIRCPLYLTVGLEEQAAHAHLEWRQLTREGHSIRARPTLGDDLLAGGWYFMNWLHPDYHELIETHVRELLDNYDVDGIFFDIVVFDPAGGWSPKAAEFRLAKGLHSDEPGIFDRFLVAAQQRFANHFTRLIRNATRTACVFYNAAAVLTTESGKGIRIRAREQTHFEIESLPTGHWGYHHFPRIARFVAGMDSPWIGQTGRFQKGWGDFGGIKPVPALEYECFRTQALGGAIGVGDQLPPRGRFDPDAIKLIGKVFQKVEAAEPFYAGAEPWFDIGVFAAGSPGCDWPMIQRSESGAVMLCQRSRRNPVLLDDAAAFESLPAVILPDDVRVSDALAKRLRDYYENGGKLVLSFRSGFDEADNWKLGFLPFRPITRSGFRPTYWRTSPDLCERWSRSERVVYSEGMNTHLEAGAEVLVQRVLPCFQRTDAQFSSHFQAPPRLEADANPALIAGERFLYFADPLFREFRQSGQIYIGDIWCECLHKLLGAPLLDVDLPPSIEAMPMRKGDDLHLTLLRYLPARKALEIDIIDESLPFDGEFLSFSRPLKKLTRFPEGRELEHVVGKGYRLGGYGRLLLQASGYFS
jgi:hypothetical protein